jgi:hypothetical protein
MTIKINFTDAELESIIKLMQNAIMHSKLSKDKKSERVYTALEDKIVHEYTAHIIEATFP